MKDKFFLCNSFFAHRGLHFESPKLPENSIGAFINAVKNHYPIELDIQITNDKHIVVFHDDNLKRLCDIDINITEVSYGDIKYLRIMNTNFTIPLLADVLSVVNGKVPILIEVKNIRTFDLPIIMEQLANYKGKYAIQSFDEKVIIWLKENKPEIIRGQLIDDISILEIYSKNDFYQSIGNPDFLSVSKEIVRNEFLQSISKNNNIPILIWTIISEKELEIYKTNFSSVIFENFII